MSTSNQAALSTSPEPSSTTQKSILIVGGSLAGLFTGVALKHHLRHVSPPPRITILERSPSPLLHDQGAGVVAGGDTQAFFERYDRFQRTLAVKSRARQYLNKDGDVIDHEEREQSMTSWDLLWNLLRRNFDGGGEGKYVDGYEEKGIDEDEDRDGGVHCEYLHDCNVTSVDVVPNLNPNANDAPSSSGVRATYTTSSSSNSSTLTATLLIAADGPSSPLRTHLSPSVQRTYAGYVAWRGTVPESELSSNTSTILTETFTFHHAPALQILAYTIPGTHGSLEPGTRLVNWVWYVNYAPSTPELEDLMTDVDGHRHRWTVPADKMQPRIWAARKDAASAALPPQFAELVRKTEKPFVQCVSDVLGEDCVFLGGKVLAVGDAVAGFRPHTAASTSQAAFDAMGLAGMLGRRWGREGGGGGGGGGGVGGGDEGKDESELEEWREQTMRYARQMQRHGVELGQRSQFGEHPLAR